MNNTNSKEIKVEWQDSTTYNRYDKEKKQTGWTLQLPSLRITITCNYRGLEGEFVMHCHALGFDTYRLNLKEGEPIENVQKTAIDKCRARLNNYQMQLNSI